MERFRCVCSVISVCTYMYLIAEDFYWTKYRQTHLPLYCNAVKVTISSMIVNTGQKNTRIKILPMRTGGEIGKIFLVVKISSYTVSTMYNIMKNIIIL